MIIHKCNRLTEGLLSEIIDAFEDIAEDPYGEACSTPSDCIKAYGSWKVEEITCGRMTSQMRAGIRATSPPI